MLNRVKEARMQLGRVKLVTPEYVKDASDHVEAPRVILQANRPRTRHVEDAEQCHQIFSADTGNSTTSSPARQSSSIAYNELTITARENMANWEKAPGLQRIKYKVLQWARSVRHAAQDCRSPAEDVVITSDQPTTKEKDNPLILSHPSNPAKLIPVDEDGETRQLS